MRNMQCRMQPMGKRTIGISYTSSRYTLMAPSLNTHKLHSTDNPPLPTVIIKHLTRDFWSCDTSLVKMS